MNAIDVLKKYWGHNKFRLNQELVIKDLIDKKDTIALLPTAGGKSICYQIPTLMQEGMCLVISPLLALMNDQVKHLHSKGIKSIAISNNMHYSEIDTALTNCIYGGVKFLYLSPEKLQNNLVKTRIKEMNIKLIAVDEAHCISEWGHNFRPSYLQISKIRNIVSENIPILALTATANSEVIIDIQKNLLFKKENLIKSSFVRKNISYVVDNITDKKIRLIKLLNKIKSPVIIYVGSRIKSKEISEFLVTKNFSANYYHAGLSNEIRKKRQESWTENQTRIMVATNSFGMGIDKPDVKLVVHMDLPSSIETYFQEAGRAGRNGKIAYSFLLANNFDIEKQKKLLNLKYPPINEITKCYQNITNYLQIGIGDFPNDPIPFDISLFSNRYKINPIKLNNILQYLEKEEKIKVSNGFNVASKIKIIITSSELYRFQITNKYYDPFIKLLLRSYNNIYNNFITIDEKKISNQSNRSIEEVKKILLKLQQLEIIEYQENNNLAQLKFLQRRQDLKSIHLNKKKWDERKLHDIAKLNKIAEYITNKSCCRSQWLINYFNEKSEKCGVCDICVIEKRKDIKDKIFNDISQEIKKLLINNEMTLKEIIESLSNISEKETISILNILFNKDKITKFGSKYKWK